MSLADPDPDAPNRLRIALKGRGEGLATNANAVSKATNVRQIGMVALVRFEPAAFRL